MRLASIFFMCFVSLFLKGQINQYQIRFEKAVHHEAVIRMSFPEIETDTLEVRMSRSSPGRYALHEFAKNVYGFRATDGQGRALSISRPDPYSWKLSGHDGTVNLSYTLFANRGDGTYSQIDESHAHLNIPATFMYAPLLKDRKIEVRFEPRGDLNWKIATQLPLVKGTTYSAPNLYYFMDSPVELSNYQRFEFIPPGTDQRIVLALHHNGSETEGAAYFEQLKKVVLEAKAVFGKLPRFDYGSYTFLGCYIPNVSGDGMEHRNSTVLTSTRALAEGGMEQNISTVSHEFFHIWNVERLRPRSLEPFVFEKANMSGLLWFAEGFTSYYTDLLLCRAGLLSVPEYVEGLAGTFNYVWNSPARQFFNPVEMSYQAPFTDAATSIDPVNQENTFISYYSYGSTLGLALDLTLRKELLSLDGYMQLLWEKYGEKEIPYTLQDLQNTLREYAGKATAEAFFSKYILKSGMPDYLELFHSVGIALYRDEHSSFSGLSTSLDPEGKRRVSRYPAIGSPAYKAGVTAKDVILSVDSIALTEMPSLGAYLGTKKEGDTLLLQLERFGQKKQLALVLAPDPKYIIELQEKKGEGPGEDILKRRKAWLKTD